MPTYTRFPNSKRALRTASDGPSVPTPVDLINEAEGAPANESSREPQGKQGTSSRDLSTVQTGTGSRTLLTIFLITLVIPLQFFIGPAQLTPYRVFLIIMMFPLLAKWLSGGAGKIQGLDFVFLGFVFWVDFTFIVNHGLTRIELLVINPIETFGAFLAGRVYIRSSKDFERLTKFLVICLFIFIPVALYEGLTTTRIIAEAFDLIGKTHPWAYSNANAAAEMRLGLNRAQVVFEHPILFGVFTATAFGILYYSLRSNDKGISGYRRGWLSVAATFLSLSTGAFLAVVAQIGLVSWDKIMGRRPNHWKILLGLVALAYVVVDLISNRTPFEVFISYAAFSAQTGYMRVIIFVYGMDNVWANPIFGLGLSNWVRPAWMYSTSVDNFWLVMALRHGFPGFLLIAWTFIGTIIRLSSLQLKDLNVRNQRTGLVVVYIGLALSLMTVHAWGAVYVYICFLLGAGSWMRDYARENPVVEPEADTQSKSRRK